jgi:hypothetical protein
MTMITTTDGTEIYCKDATLVGHSTNGGAVYIRRHGTKRVVLVAAVPPIMLKSAANPEGLPMEHFDKLRSGINVRDGEWLGEMGVIEGRSRNATAPAAADGEVEVLTARQCSERVQRTGARTRSDSAAQHQTAADRGQATLPQQQSGQSHTHELNPIDADNTSMRLLPPSVLCRLIDEFEELAQ